MIDIYNASAVCDDARGLTCGEGVCQADGTCECSPLWSTAADFVEIETDCPTSFIGMYVLWGINLLLLLYVYYKSFSIILLRFEVFLETKRNRKGYTLWQNKGLLAIIAYFAISTPFHFIMCIINFVNPEVRIGFDLLPTLCFFFGKLGLYICIFFVQGTMLSQTLKGDSRQGRIVQYNYIFQGTVSGLSIFLGALPFITLTNFQSAYLDQVIIMQAYYLLQSLVLICNGCGAFVVRHKVNSALNKVRDLVESTGKSEGIRKKVHELQTTAIRQGLFQGVVYLLMGSIPFFINKHKYFLPISWLAMPILGMKLAHQISTDKQAKNLMQRLGIAKTGSSSAQQREGELTNTNMVSATNLNSPSFQTSFNNGPNPSEKFESTNPVYASTIQGFKAYRKKKKLTPQQQSSFFSSEGALLEDLLEPENPFHKKFVNFVKLRYAENEVAMLELTIKYKAASDSKERARLGKKIVNEYVNEKAPRAVDLDHNTRDVLLSTAKRGQWVPTTFDEIRHVLMFDLKGNFLAGFEKHLEQQQEKNGKVDV